MNNLSDLIDTDTNALEKLLSAMGKGVNKHKKAEVQRADELDPDDPRYDTSKIIYPRGMDLHEAQRHIKQQLEYEETETDIYHEVDCFPTDGAYSLMQVMRSKYGWAQAVPTPGFFGPSNPTMISIPISNTETAEIMWGSFTLPGISGRLECGQGRRRGRSTFVISGTIKRKYEKEVKELARLVREYVKENSLYKGRAIKLFTNDNGETDMDTPPEFLQDMNVTPKDLIFNENLSNTINAELFTVIRATEHLRKLNIPVKRGLLLAGPYGCGKTLTAGATSSVCVENGWTYIYLEDVSGLPEAIEFSARYQPCVLFAEDIDRIVGTQERTTQVDAVLNHIDGVDGKSREMIVVFTTNHLENINRAMLRPGRLDSVIEIGPPDRETAERMCRHYAGDKLPADANLVQVGEQIDGLIPACINDTVIQAQYHALAQGRTDGSLTAESLLNAAISVRNQSDTLKALDQDVILSDEEQLGTILGVIMAKNSSDAPEEKRARKFLKFFSDRQYGTGRY